MPVNKKDYALRITNATPNELNIINFELCIEYLKESIFQLENDFSQFGKNINTSLSLLKEIIVSLNFDYDISKELRNIYLYVNKLIINSKFSLDKKDLEDAISILSTIKGGFEELNDTESDKVMKNATKVFAGLTYGKNGDLSEYIDDDKSRGFQA